MTIATQPLMIAHSAPRGQIQSSNGGDGQPPEPNSTMVDRIVNGTYLSANFAASSVSGAVAGLGAFVRSAPGATLKTTASLYTNMWKAQTIGPNLKIIGSLVGAPLVLAGAVLGLPVSAAAGLFFGARQVDSDKPRQFTIVPAAQQGFARTKAGWEGAVAGLQSSLTEMGNQKLAEGEKPFDIPLIKTAKTLAVGAAAVAVGAAAGVACALVGTLSETGRGIAGAFQDESLNLPGKALGAVGAVIGGVVHGVSFGLTTTLSTIGQGLGETWKQDSIVGGGKSVLVEAGQSIAASAAPHTTLLQEKK